jgi:ABC-type lipoprotein release transport system permease subunit
MWGETPAIGQRFILKDHLMEVVGVAADGKYYQIIEPQQPAVFLPLFQTENGVGIFVVRTPRSQNEMAATLERTLNSLEPDAQIKVQSWLEVLGAQNALFPTRAATIALCVLGVLAAMLAVTGIFGMAAYNVSRRMKELGIRVALGARTRHVITVAVGRPIVLLGVGSLVGLVWGVFASGLLGRIVYQPDPRDPVVVVGAILAMALLGIAASAIPALRAVAVDPSKLLRED